MEKLEQCIICGNKEFSEYLKGTDYFLTQEKFTIVKCNKCDFIFVNPRPDVQEIGKYYKSEEYISHSNNKNGLLNKVYHIIRKRNHGKKYELISNFKSNGKLLDIGCATGEFLNYVKKNNWETVGIEPDSDAREFAKTAYNLNVQPEVYLNELKSESFDIITMWHVLEHVHELKERLEQIQRLLVKNGVAIIAVPNAACYDSKIYSEYWAGYDLPRHIYHFTQETIIKLFERHNFKFEKRVPMKYDAYYISMLSEKYKSGSKNLVKAFFNGYKSNLWAKRNNDNFSSLIYVFRKVDSI